MTTESQKAFEEWEELYWQDKKKYATARLAWQASRQCIIAKLQSKEMVERVCAALAREQYEYAMWIEDTEDDNIANAHNCEEYINKHWTGFKDQAKAAIAAVLEGI